MKSILIWDKWIFIITSYKLKFIYVIISLKNLSKNLLNSKSNLISHLFTSFPFNKGQVKVRKNQLYSKETHSPGLLNKLLKPMVWPNIVKLIHLYLHVLLFHFYLELCLVILVMVFFYSSSDWLWYLKSINWLKWVTYL